jgi:hypothetical protein
LPSLAKILSPVVIAGLAVSQFVPSAAADDLGARRRQVEQQRAQTASQLNVLKSSQGQIQRALDTLDRNIASQQAALGSARQAADAATVALRRAQMNEARTTARVATLRSRLADAALDAYVGTSSSAVFDALRAGDLGEIARQREYLSYAVTSTSATLDQLRAAREDLLSQRRAAQRAKQQADTRRSLVQDRFVGLVQAQRQQLQFAGQVENKINMATSQADELAGVDAQVGAQIAAQQAAATSSSSVTHTAGNLCLTTVRTITINCQIASQLDKMLSAAQADGFTLTGQGYRSADQQIAVRRSNCGPSDYDVYQMPPGDCHPPTALPGTSMHEVGLAVDFMWNGSLLSSHSNPAWQWLNAHAATYGFYNLPSESWHWSVNGH